MKLCFLYFVLWSCTALAVQPVKLTKAQMLEDFEFLQKTINDYAVFIPLVEKRMGISVRDHLKALQQEITSETTPEEFAGLVRHGLNILYDGHSNFCGKDALKWNVTSTYNYLKEVSNAELSDTLYADYYTSVVADRVYQKNKSNIFFKYADGKYYVTSPFTVNGISIKSREEVTAVNGIPIDSFVNNLFPKLYYTGWDPICKKLYSDMLLTSLPPAGYETCIFTIGDKEVPIDTRTQIPGVEKIKYGLPRTPLVTLLENDILYIRMPMMMSYGWYVNQIKKIYHPKIKKVIFDIRLNGGGDDNVWREILSHLLKNPFQYTYRVEMNHHEKLKNAIAKFGEIEIEGNKMTVSRNRTILPDSNSVGFDGHIYILQGRYTYSAASAFISAAKQNKEKFTVIGEPGAMISGYTFPGIVFVLPHSKIVYKIAFSMDVTGGTTDPYMDQPDILITENIDDYLDRFFIHNPQEISYLQERDKCIKYVKGLQ